MLKPEGKGGANWGHCDGARRRMATAGDFCGGKGWENRCVARRRGCASSRGFETAVWTRRGDDNELHIQSRTRNKGENMTRRKKGFCEPRAPDDHIKYFPSPLADAGKAKVISKVYL